MGHVESFVRQIGNLSTPCFHMFSIFFCTEHIIHPPNLYAPQQGVFSQTTTTTKKSMKKLFVKLLRTSVVLNSM